jgi:hypothetical protein
MNEPEKKEPLTEVKSTAAKLENIITDVEIVRKLLMSVTVGYATLCILFLLEVFA